ncbi:peptidase M20 [Chitinispirillum alkaliphilum]|nr:peptidase M20 [Chitinispirillum alkaliphilum]
MESVIRKTIDSEIEKGFPDTRDIRRKIHKNPELSGKETDTAALVYTTLKNRGFDPKYHLDKTAVSVELKNGKGKKIVLRADMDALPITEENDIDFKSQNEGVMHACGHDMHTAILTGAISVLWNLRRYWSGTVVCIFQPSEEEEPGGAFNLIKKKVFPADADAVFGLHVNPSFRTGIIGIKKGYDFAGVTLFDVVVKGRGGHGASPENSVDPIVCASSMIMSLQTIVSRECPVVQPAVITVGSLHSGVRRNIIPDTAEFQGTIRYHSDKLEKFIVSRIKEKLKKTAQSFRAGVDIRFEKSYPPCFNDEELARKTQEAFIGYFGNREIKKLEYPSMYAEDFSRYQQLVPGLYVHLGVGSGNKKNVAGIHSSRFLPDESAIKSGVAAHVVFAITNLA